MKSFMKKTMLAVLICCLLLPSAPTAFAAIIYGDVTFDGAVTAEDARLTLRNAVGLEAFTKAQHDIGDLDGDDEITAADARLVLRLAVGLPLDDEEEEPGPIDEPEPIDEPDPPTPTKEELRDAWLASFPSSVSYDDISSNMYWLVNDIGVRNWWSSSQNNAGDLIYDRLYSYGFTGTQRQKLDFYWNGTLGRNILAVIPTAVANPDILLISAHYDTARGTGGAVDNSSGTVALLQLAKKFKATGQDYGVEVRFLFTAGEEQGYYGAYGYLNNLSYSERSRHAFVFNIDMAGRPNTNYYTSTEFVLAVSTEPVSTDGYSAPSARENPGSLALDAARAALPDVQGYKYYSPVRAGMHDIVAFRKAGMPASTLSWRCIDYSRSNGSDYGRATPSFVHTASDNIYNFDMISLYETTRLAAGAVARLICPYTDLA